MIVVFVEDVVCYYVWYGIVMMLLLEMDCWMDDFGIIMCIDWLYLLVVMVMVEVIWVVVWEVYGVVL